MTTTPALNDLVQRLKASRAVWDNAKSRPTDLELEAAAALEAQSKEIEALRSALEPFSDVAGEMFARGWDASNVALALDNPNDEHRVTAGDFFTARTALKGA